MKKKAMWTVGALFALTMTILVAAWLRLTSRIVIDEDPSPRLIAQEALLTYFSLLHDGNYSEAVALFSGSYGLLRDWNPGIDPNDYAALFENGCTINGLMCLQVLNVIHEEQISPEEFKFTVEFMNEDGSLFVSGPETTPQSQFIFTVLKDEDGKFLVQDSPVYTP
ncbi:MAG TPA: hypothetical protein VI524_08755 [Anaerolineales bacterium]|nr:hypothetical protein [Anaerolineales bacterium]